MKGLVLVTGGAGFIGSHVSRALLGLGYGVRIYDNLYFPNRAALAELQAAGAEFVEGDVRYRSAVEAAMEGATHAVHLAALSINKSVADPEESVNVNLNGSHNVIMAAIASGIDKLVFASTASVYGEPESLPMRETDPPSPLTPYDISKLAGEHLLRFYAGRDGLRWVALRFFNVYGPGQQTKAYYTSVIQTFIQRIMAGEPPVIQGSGEQSMDFVHVSDVASAVVAALESDVTGEAFNIGTGVSTSVKELADIIVEALGSEVSPIFEPREVLASRRAADVSKAKRLLGWEPQVDAVSGLRDLALQLSDAAD
jgi:UDP-glucose 4-epimerase